MCWVILLISDFHFLTWGRYGTLLAKKGFRVLELRFTEVLIVVSWFMMLTSWDLSIHSILGTRSFSNRFLFVLILILLILISWCFLEVSWIWFLFFIFVKLVYAVPVRMVWLQPWFFSITLHSNFKSWQCFLVILSSLANFILSGKHKFAFYSIDRWLV